jgi:hypothetical protein
VDKDSLTFEQMYRDLCAAEMRSRPPVNSFSVNEFANDTGLKYNTAIRKLLKLDASGELKSGIFIVDGHEKRLFWFPDDTPLH